MINLDYYLNRGEEYRFNVNFTVGIDGVLSDIVIQSEQGYLLPHVEKDIIKVFKAMPRWTPASQNNKRVPTTFKLPIKVNVQ
ncbi:energy transducer TonB [Myroides sp. M-43]|uniref:energy transducer TonB n=1 Tax=Myroides oncorhynchi TaxID=2893756 RepID=UPI001E3BE889|nr:energy transducer TonB [Myroides oncorhynchi]MCC9041273.1 energy transducer TonB [Myroides oncorhynchi]